MFSLDPCESQFEQIINTTIILNNKYCFKHDPVWGDLLKHFWMRGLTKKHRDLINTRVVGDNGDAFDQLQKEKSHTCYACATHVMQSSIHARMQKIHLLCTHLDYMNTTQDAPLHTIITEGNICNLDNHKAKIS